MYNIRDVFTCPCGCNEFVVSTTRKGIINKRCINCNTIYGEDNNIILSSFKLDKIIAQQSMAQTPPPTLITCPACNKQVSNQAPSCPHCGQPIDTRPKCPTCGSPDIKKMSHIGKSASIWFWGLTSDKINKTWQCNKCGQTW